LGYREKFEQISARRNYMSSWCHALDSPAPD
jgi:hypothetical protein